MPTVVKTTCWTDSSSLMTKMKWFKNKVSNSYGSGKKQWSMELDELLTTELNKMKDISLDCHHRPSRTRNRFAYERVPSDWTKIPTLVEDMNVALNAPQNWYTSLRHNPVLAVFMSNVSTMIEVAMRLKTRPNIQHVIVCDCVMSVKHMLLIMVVFQLLFKDENENDSVFMHLCVDENQEKIARRSPLKNKHVVMHRDMAWYAALGLVETRYRSVSVTMMMNEEMSMDNIESLFSTEDVFVSLTSSMDKINYSNALMDLVRSRSMVRELVPGSNPDTNTVRISDAIVNHNVSEGRLVYRARNAYSIMPTNTCTNMIRPMNLDGMCFDCRIVYMVANDIVLKTCGQNKDQPEYAGEEWSRSFARTITKDTMSISNNVIASLKAVSNVPVFVGQRESVNDESILISSVKLNELTAMYSDLYAFTYSTWRHLPDAPDCERTFVIMWMISAENYDINHFTIKWPEASSNTFVHLWSIVDRLRTLLESNNADWLVGARNPVGYSETMNMPGAADQHLYPSESIIAPHVEVFSSNMARMQPKTIKRSYDSNFFFTLSLTMSRPKRVIDPSQMAMRNDEMLSAAANRNRK
ncbi:uncharacterized protein LTR77_011247 [Saxophila tyrrhenica]|uniref:Uncharacterized protein n=1 Tax=Saxophila tyrrhenica TaxID=1690608 RepID=A0AAV9NT17_9PEZI|nr:hypothetical protein LTR77_011247 [Saxophila tyrrhenica]